METVMFRFILSLALASVCLVSLTHAQAPGQRQYYSAKWTKHTTKNYYYRNYYFKKAAKDEEYTYHYAIYFPSRGKRIYMYNPQSRKYWGAWEGDKYSLLPKDKQKASLDEIAAEDFPPFAAAPTIPGATDEVTMIPPPKDFPKADDDRP
jgi:hypothetical protein